MAEKCKNSHELTTEFADDEFEVAGILLELRKLFTATEFFPLFRVEWGSKKRRSTTYSNNQASPATVPPPPEPSSSPPEDPVDERCTGKNKASSPATPLSFSPSESDEKRKPSKRKLLKRADWLELIKELTERRDMLKKEVENVSRYFDKLKAFNSELKARKEELITRGLKKEIRLSKIGQSVNHEMELGQPNASTPFPEFHHPPFIMDRTVQATGISENLQFSASHIPSSGFSRNNNSNNIVSPLGLPDLNVSPEEPFGMDFSQPFDLAMADKNRSRAMGSEARRRRRQICRDKTSVAANKLRNPC